MSTGRPYTQYALMAELFRYPAEDFRQKVIDVQTMLRVLYPEVADTLQRFTDWAEATPLHEVEEIFSRTFHVQAICYLDLGFVIFGEDYKRGEFLVNMKREQAEAGNDCGEELPDNLANVLSLLPLLKDDDFRNELAGRVMMPALRKMMAEFSPRKLELRTNMLRKKHNAIIMDGHEDMNVYHDALLALFRMLETDFTEVALAEHRPNGLDPLRAAAPASDCGTCSIPHSPLIKTDKP